MKRRHVALPVLFSLCVLFAPLAVDNVGADTGELTPAAPGGGTYHPVLPARILDTRSGIGGAPGALGVGATFELTVLGHDGVPASAVNAVVLNVTAVDPTSEGFLTVYPTGEERPEVSNLNFSAAQNVANAVTVAVGFDGELTFYNAFGTTHVVADVVGWYDDTGVGGGRYNPVTPGRVMDTRNGIGPLASKLGADASVDLPVLGQFGVPASGVSAVVVNVTATNQTSEGFLTIWPAGTSVPAASSVNFVAGKSVANLVTVGVNPTSGAIGVFNKFGATDVLVDVVGWYDTNGMQGSLFYPVLPHRVLDTRPDHSGLIEDEGATMGFVDAVPLAANALVMNVTAAETTSAGFLTVFPADAASIPETSTVNWNGPRAIVPNMAISGVSVDGEIAFYNAFGYTDILVDVFGYFSPV